MSVEIALETWSPEDAAKALAVNHVNRKVRGNNVTKYARDMSEGRWRKFCPDPVTFNTKGELINGQHRANAQIVSNTEQTWLVVRNAPDDTQEVMDTGGPRVLADMLSFAGIKNSTNVGAALKMCQALSTGRIYLGNRASATSSTSEMLEFFAAHPEVLYSNKVGNEVSRTGTAPTSPSALAASHWWIAQHVGVEEADAFMERIGSLVGEREGSPVIALVKRLNEIRRNRQRTEARWILYMVIKAWNYDVRGLDVSKISLTTKTGAYKLLIPLKPGEEIHPEDYEDE